MNYAEVIRADGSVVKVAIFGAIVDPFLNAEGECEVLFYIWPRRWLSKRDTGFVLAARAVLTAEQVSTDCVIHWTALDSARRRELQDIARDVGYPVDAVFFVLSALRAAARRPSGAVLHVGFGGEERSEHHVGAQELCDFIPRHAAWIFGDSVATKVLSAWGLRKGEDIAAIISGCVEAGWLKPRPGKSDEFRDIELLPDGPAKGASWKLRGTFRQSLLMFSLRLGFTIAVFVGAVLWTERLSAQERPLVGRWYAFRENADELTVVEISSDRSFAMQTLRREQADAPQRSPSMRWAVHDREFIVTPGVRTLLDRVGRAFAPAPKHARIVANFQMPDPDTFETNRRFRRVPAGLASYADLFPPRPAEAGIERP